MVAFIGHATLAGEAEFAGRRPGTGAGLQDHQQVGYPAAVGPQGHPEATRPGFIGEPFAESAQDVASGVVQEGRGVPAQVRAEVGGR